MAHQRGDVQGLMDWLSRAAKEDPQHFSLIKNVNAARAWFAAGGPAKGLELALTVRHDFQLLSSARRSRRCRGRSRRASRRGGLRISAPRRRERGGAQSGGVRGGDEGDEGDARGEGAAGEADAPFVKTPDVDGSRRGLEGRARVKVLP